MLETAVQIDPYAWVFTGPLTIALIQLYFQPPEHPLKRLWRALVQVEAESWERLEWLIGSVGPRITFRYSLHLLWLPVIGLGLGSLASFAAFMGWLPSA